MEHKILDDIILEWLKVNHLSLPTKLVTSEVDKFLNNVAEVFTFPHNGVDYKVFKVNDLFFKTRLK